MKFDYREFSFAGKYYLFAKRELPNVVKHGVELAAFEQLDTIVGFDEGYELVKKSVGDKYTVVFRVDDEFFYGDYVVKFDMYLTNWDYPTTDFRYIVDGNNVKEYNLQPLIDYMYSRDMSKVYDNACYYDGDGVYVDVTITVTKGQENALSLYNYAG